MTHIHDHYDSHNRNDQNIGMFVIFIFLLAILFIVWLFFPRNAGEVVVPQGETIIENRQEIKEADPTSIPTPTKEPTSTVTEIIPSIEGGD